MSDRVANAALDALNLPVALLDQTGTITYLNSAWRATACESGPGFALSQGDNYLRACETAAKMFPGSAFLLRALSRILAGRQIEFDRVCQFLHEQNRRDFRIRIKRLEDAARPAVMVSCEEVTALTAAQAEVGEMAEQLLAVQADERQRLALELHDSVGQDLVSIGLGLSRLRILAPRNQGLSTVIGDIASSLQEAHAQIRSLAYLLNPPWPEHGGRLESAVREFVEGFGRRAGLRAEVDVAGAPFELDRVREIALFRILQESLVNVHRHAKAHAVVVQLASLEAQVRLSIRDDGRGFASPPGRAPQLGVGLSGMQRRVAQLGGELKIATGPTGTSVVATVPGVGALRPASTGPRSQPSREHRGGADAPVLAEARSWKPSEPGRRRDGFDCKT